MVVEDKKKKKEKKWKNIWKNRAHEIDVRKSEENQ